MSLALLGGTNTARERLVPLTLAGSEVYACLLAALPALPVRRETVCRSVQWLRNRRYCAVACDMCAIAMVGVGSIDVGQN